MQVLIWDQPGSPPEPPEGMYFTWAWRSFARGNAIRSVPRYLEDNAQRLRQKYLAFIHELAEHQIGGRPIIDHLDLGDDFSFWWMTLLAEKSPLKSPGIYASLRLLALEEILLDTPPGALVLVSGDRALARALRHLCGKLRIVFTWRSSGSPAMGLSLRRLYESLPHALKGLLSLRHIVKRWSLRKVRSPRWFAGERAVLICSYFIHLEPDQCSQGRFHSRQWEHLPRALQAAGRPTNWIQLFLFSAAVPDVATGVDWLRRFNRDAGNEGCHSFLDSYLTARNVLVAVRSWLRLLGVGWRLRAIESFFYPAGSSVWLWPVLQDDWRASIAGTTAMSNCLAVALFDAALAEVPRQRTGLYLCENQPWEKALLHAWRKHGHGEIVGVQHATVPFWHLYYFEDPRSLRARNRCALPLPDRLAVNGAAPLRAFRDSHYPPERLVEVEALRYMHLRELPAGRAPPGQGSAATRSDQTVIRVLVLGDLIAQSMHHLLRLLQDSMPQLPPTLRFTLKPHPGLAVDLNEYPGLRIEQTREALGKILGSYDVALAANCTSAAVDAYVTGLSVIIGVDGDALNLSPLRGQSGVCFISTPEELVEALRAPERAAVADYSREEFFFLDSELPRWQRLLEYGQ